MVQGLPPRRVGPVGRKRGLPRKVRHDPPAGASLAVAGDRVGIAQGQHDLPFPQAAASPNAIGARSSAAIDNTARSLRGSAARTLARYAFRVVGDDVILALFAEDVIGGEDQSASIDDHAGAILRGNEVRIGRLRRRGQAQAAAERVGPRFEAKPLALLLLPHAGDGDDGFFAPRDRRDEDFFHRLGDRGRGEFVRAERRGEGRMQQEVKQIVRVME